MYSDLLSIQELCPLFTIVLFTATKFYYEEEDRNISYLTSFNFYDFFYNLTYPITYEASWGGCPLKF